MLKLQLKVCMRLLLGTERSKLNVLLNQEIHKEDSLDQELLVDAVDIVVDEAADIRRTEKSRKKSSSDKSEDGKFDI